MVEGHIPVTLTQLRALVEVAATGSVRQAAERLVVSQPAVSAALAALQKELGLALTAREGRGLRITPAGQVFARYARQVLGLLEQGKDAAAGVLHPERGRLRLAAVTTAGEHVVPPLLASFRGRYPEADVLLEVGNRRRVWELLEYRQVDLAVGGHPPGDGRFASLATRPNSLVVVAQQDGRPARARASEEGIAKAVWLLREPGSGTRATAEELLEEIGISPVTLTLGSNGAIRESVQVGLGVTLISRDAVARELDQGLLRELRFPGVPRQRSWHVVARADEELPATAALFLGHLVDGGEDGSPDRFRLMGDGPPPSRG